MNPRKVGIKNKIPDQRVMLAALDMTWLIPVTQVYVGGPNDTSEKVKNLDPEHIPAHSKSCSTAFKRVSPWSTDRDPVKLAATYGLIVSMALGQSGYF